MSARVIGIDPSLTATGLADWDGTVETYGGDAKLGDRRLSFLYNQVKFHCQPGVDMAVIEDLPANAKSAGLTGKAQGVVRLALIRADVPYVAISPAALKKFATGRGNATKSDMRMELYKRTGIDLPDDNQVDAWWLRAAGMQHLGEPVVDVPESRVAGLDYLIWPELVRDAA